MSTQGVIRLSPDVAAFLRHGEQIVDGLETVDDAREVCDVLMELFARCANQLGLDVDDLLPGGAPEEDDTD